MLTKTITRSTFPAAFLADEIKGQTNVMVDIETMGKSPKAPITSIGAVLFDPFGDWIGDRFYIHVSLENGLRSGKAADSDTLQWWMCQDEAARTAFVAGQCEAAPVITALEAFSAWLPDNAAPWANGAGFDFAILSNHYHDAGLPVPWKYWLEHDLRTLKRLYPHVEIDHEGIKHHALHDAIHQARLVQEIIRQGIGVKA